MASDPLAETRRMVLTVLSPAALESLLEKKRAEHMASDVLPSFSDSPPGVRALYLDYIKDYRDVWLVASA